MKSVHPFPARMAPELALHSAKTLPSSSTVLDPMAGSGTVLRQAASLGHKAIGFDLDPLAVLISRVETCRIKADAVTPLAERIVKQAKQLSARNLDLPWIDDDEETGGFVNYWFGERQKTDLRRLSALLVKNPWGRKHRRERNVLLVALSRLIVTKERGASLARDVSHSRPHKVREKNDFDVLSEFLRAVDSVQKYLHENPVVGPVRVMPGDARALTSIPNASVDAVITSPPYLNAIDYLRGHRLSLVWLGYRLSDLRAVRSISVGAERAPDEDVNPALFDSVVNAMTGDEELCSRDRKMIVRYGHDVYRILSEISRILKSAGRAVIVIGNSCLHGTFIRNSAGVIAAASMVGLSLESEIERDLPVSSRYLPIPKTRKSSLGKRMRTENILNFTKP